MSQPLLLLVEDDKYLRRVLARALEARGFAVLEAGDLEQARAHLHSATAPPSHAVIDLRLPDGSGLDLCTELAGLENPARVVVLTGWGSIPTALEAVRRGAVDFLAKPIEIESLLRALAIPLAAQPEVQLEPPVPSLGRVEWEHIQRVLASCEGNVSQAARLLGIHRRSLQRKLGKRPPTR